MLGFYRTYTTPFNEAIPVSITEFFKNVPFYKRFRRFLGRYLYTEITLRKSKKITTILKEHKRILWIQWVDSYLGDSLMDLSSRILLRDKTIDLLTKDNVAKIYQQDSFFNHIYTNPKSASNNSYDLIIIGSYRQRELKVVVKYFPTLAHTSLIGYYHVSNFNRLYFSFYRINQLLSNFYDKRYIDSIAKPYLPVTANDKIIVENLNLPKNFITIAIGGASKSRTFNAWDKVIDRLLANNIVENIVLIGLQNSEQYTKPIIQKHPKKVINMVNRCSFNQSAQIIKKSIMLLCVDGGLLHAANAVQTPVVALFHSVNPMMRFIKVNKCRALSNTNSINNINVGDIINKAEQLKFDVNYG